MAGDRTERPTARRLRDARKKGQVARSRDLTEAVQLIAILMAITLYGESYVRRLGAAVQQGLASIGSGAGAGIEPDGLSQLAANGTVTLAILAGPFAVTAIVASVGAAGLQGGWTVATEAIGLHWERLSPVAGVKRVFSRAGFDVVKMLIAVTALSWLAWRIVDSTMLDATLLARLTPERAAATGWRQVERLLRQSAIALALIAGADYLLQRWRVARSLRMTKQEVRDDMRLTEGNPEVKARIRRIQRDMARRRMLASVPKATVVITNPTHYAVALEYRRDFMAAPRVLAKGRNAIADRIRAIAREHGIPIVENVPLAQSLHRAVDVGDFIPAELFGAVAEVLAYLVRLKQVVL